MSDSTYIDTQSTWLDGFYSNRSLKLKGPDGKFLGPEISGQEMQDALADTNNNPQQAEFFKKQLALLPSKTTGLKKNYTFSTTGKISPEELKAIGRLQNQSYAKTPFGQPVDMFAQLNNIKTNADATVDKTTKPQVVITTYRPYQIADKVNAAFMKARGTKATASELQSITDELNAEEKKHPSVTTYSVVKGKNVTSVVPGVIEDTFINNRVASYASKTPAAR